MFSASSVTSGQASTFSGTKVCSVQSQIVGEYATIDAERSVASQGGPTAGSNAKIKKARKRGREEDTGAG